MQFYSRAIDISSLITDFGKTLYAALPLYEY